MNEKPVLVSHFLFVYLQREIECNMKLFTDFEQTQILKSLGYSHPISERGYNIGELMSFLPPVQIEPLGDYDRITVDGEPPKQYIETQVIDALYWACVGQKEDVKEDDLGEVIAQKKKEYELLELLLFLGADGRNRTGTVYSTAGF